MDTLTMTPTVRAALAVTLAAVLTACGVDSTTTAADEPSTGPEPVEAVTSEAAPPATESPAAASPAEGYPAFADVDTYTSGYFIALEGTTLAQDQGEERLYNIGVRACERFDCGTPIAEEVEALAVESSLGGPAAGSLVGAAVGHLCPQHTDAAQEYADSGG